MKAYRIRSIPHSSTVKFLNLYSRLERFIDWYYTEDDIIGFKTCGVGNKIFEIHMVKCLRMNKEVSRELISGYYAICTESVEEEPYVRVKVKIEI